MNTGVYPCKNNKIIYILKILSSFYFLTRKDMGGKTPYANIGIMAENVVKKKELDQISNFSDLKSVLTKGIRKSTA
ncbi:MAG: hypothetical protein QW520_01200 [Methanomassiliicoccales archaeon]